MSWVTIRKGADWRGRPHWAWSCNVCPPGRGGKPPGGAHRCKTFTSINRPRYPSAFERCTRAALKHVRDEHVPSSVWVKLARQDVDNTLPWG